MPPPSLLSTRSRAGEPLYQSVAREIESLVDGGTFRTGDRLPSVRALGREWDVSVSTVMEAYRVLENRGLIEARPQSGYYVRARLEKLLPEPKPAGAGPCKPRDLTIDGLATAIIEDTQCQRLVQLGAAIPHSDLMPAEKLNRTMGTVLRRAKSAALAYDVIPGHRGLRSEIARRAFQAGCALSPDDVVITNGCTEAVWLALRALVRPGDTVVVESPFYFGFVQLLSSLNCRVLEVSSTSREGLSLDALSYVLGEHKVSAVLASPNFSNPTGSFMPEEKKRALVELLTERNVPLIEDDIYGELQFHGERPKSVKAFDREGIVLWCGSISKTLAPGWRLGWIAPGRYQGEIERFKRQTNLASSTPVQLAVEEFLINGGYDHHLRGMRRSLAARAEDMQQLVAKHFPPGTRMSQPEGGFVLWVELPAAFDTTAIYPLARERGVTFAPGALFCSDSRFRNCLRLNVACEQARMEEGVRIIGDVLREWSAP